MHANTPHADHDSAWFPGSVPCSHDPAGLADAGPDDLGDWWLDLGHIALPAPPAV